MTELVESEIILRKTVELRKKFNDITGAMDKARTAISHAKIIEEKVNILDSIADKLEIEDLAPGILAKNILPYIQDYLNKLEEHVTKLERYGRL